MTSSILTTKLYIPPPRADLVPRQRLINLLNNSLSHKLTLISAPAGFGKSTLLSVCIQQIENDTRVAWLSLDESDNDLTRFLTYFVAALQTIETDIGQGARAVLNSPGLVNTEAVLTNLLNKIANFSSEVVCILDDYHVIETPEIDQAITFLIEHLPTQMHLVIASRIDPTLPLSRLRARRQMVEIRADDLRFTPDEAVVFLNQVMGFSLSSQEVSSLEMRTEGWIAGLQLAALSLQGFTHDSEVAAFINHFAGSDRYIQDYLADEVLQQQSDEVHDFLLQTSILNHLNASLCDAVTEMENGQRTLEKIETANLFIVSLDNERSWYRYHHLFADLLRQRLRESYFDLIPTFHRRASKWYEKNGLPADAIRHALAANDPDRAANLAELAWPDWQGSYQSITWLGWIKELPDEIVCSRPVLSLGFAWALMNAGKLDDAGARLNDVDRWLESTRDKPQLETITDKMVVVDKAQFEALPVSLVTARTYYSQAIGDIANTVKYAQRALDLLSEEASYDRSTVTALLGLAQWTNGDLEAAHQTFSVGLAGMNPLDIIVGTFVLADIKITLGHLHEATTLNEHALRLAAEHGEPFPIGTEDVYIGISEIHRELGDLKAAAHDLDTAKKLGEQIELPDWQYRWCIAQARLKQTLGDLESAYSLLDEAERLYVQTPLPVVRPFAALKVRLWVKQDLLNKALNWVREQDLSVYDEICYLREFEHITLARVLIAQYKINQVAGSIQEAVKLLERLLSAAEEGGRTTSEIEILLLLAITQDVQGDTPAALIYLERALTLAEPEGYIRIFVDEGLPMAHLLADAAAGGTMPDYVGKLLPLFENEQVARHTQQQQNLVEPLTEREIEVLRLIARGLSNREISEQLYLALDTIKGHNRKIFGKLGVRKRLEAVTQAQELGLL